MADERDEIQKIPSTDETIQVRPGYPKNAGYPQAAGYPESYGYGNEENRFDPREIWRIIYKRRWLILVIAIIATSAVTIDVFRNKSTYKATAVIEISKDRATLMRAGDMVIQTEEMDELYNPGLAMNTRMRVIQSRPLLEDVVLELGLDQNPGFLEVTSRRSVWEAIKTLGRKTGPPEKTPQIQAPVIQPTGDAGIERSAQESARLAPYVGVLASNLSVQHPEETRLIEVSFTHTDPALAASVANTISKIFIQRSFHTKTERYTQASDWLERTTRELKAKVQQAEEALANYSQANNIYSTDSKDSLTTEKLTRLHDQVMRAETDRILKRSLFEEVSQGRVEQLPESFSDPRTASLQAKLGELALASAQLDMKYGPDNPKVLETRMQMRTLQEQINESRKTLEGRLKADYERAVRDEQALKAALDQAKGEAAEQNQATIQLNLLKQDVETAKSLYTDFLQKTNQANIQLAEQHNNLHLVEPAQPPDAPVGPNRPRAIFIGLFLSLAAGVGLAFLLEYINNTINTVEDVTRYAQLPALGVIPAVKGGISKRIGLKSQDAIASSGKSTSTAMTHTAPLAAMSMRSSVAEAYRVLRTSVLLSAAGGPPHTILITSSQPGEGKTTTTINTAISLAQLGASVLIIDCDLRKPFIHKSLGLDSSRGLSNYLSLPDRSREPAEDPARRQKKSRPTVGPELEGMIQKMQIPNLSVLPSGPVPPNPAELISSRKMRRMLKALAKRYDHILIDSPPLINVTDPVILSTMVDGVILVVHGGRSTRFEVRRARQELSNVGARIFGVVLNNVSSSHHPYDYYAKYTESPEDANSAG